MTILRLVVGIVFFSNVGLLVATEPVVPKQRFRATTQQQAEQWQTASRNLLFHLLKIEDLQATRLPTGTPIPFETMELKPVEHDKHIWKEMQIASTKDRKMHVVVTFPKDAKGVSKCPAVVCIHGHGGNRYIVHDRKSLYRGFAAELADRGFITISCDVGQHEVADPRRTLMGERLWDLLRCADFVISLPEVDAKRVGCAGLSLGGEMAMWLGAMDPRMRATVSSGFLTTVGNMRDGHCMCWDFPGLTDNFEFSDIYSLIAPRPLMCQNGEKEPRRGGFPIDLADRAIYDIQRAYSVFDKKWYAVLDIHPEGHVFVVPSAVGFLEKNLASVQ